MRTDEDTASGVAAQTRAELLERLQYFDLTPRVVVDLGCGAGAGATALRRRFPRARIIAVDATHATALRARSGQRFWRRFECVCADARVLPLAAQSVDLVYSNLMLPQYEDPAPVFIEVQRALRPNGLLMFATLGGESFPDMAQLGAALAHAGLAEPVMDRELLQAPGSRTDSTPREIIFGAAFAGRRAHRHAGEDAGAESHAGTEARVPLSSLRRRPRP